MAVLLLLAYAAASRSNFFSQQRDTKIVSLHSPHNTEL
jgi:hypothetical protein